MNVLAKTIPVYPDGEWTFTIVQVIVHPSAPWQWGITDGMVNESAACHTIGEYHLQEL